MLIIAVAVIVVIFIVLALVGAFFSYGYMAKRKEEGDLRRYLQGENCKWETMPPPRTSSDGGVFYKNTDPESSGIEMRVYYFSQPADSEDEGVCLSIIDPENSNGMILNGFAQALEAMEFGDGLWKDRFLGDAGIMERTITEKRAEWDQAQRDIIIGHYSLFM